MDAEWKGVGGDKEWKKLDADPSMEKENGALWSILATYSKEPWFKTTARTMQIAHGALIEASCAGLQAFHAKSQDIFKLSYLVFFPNTQVSAFLSTAIPIVGVVGMQGQGIPPIQLINKLQLRFCVNPTANQFGPGSGETCCTLSYLWFNRWYRQQVLAIAYAVLKNCNWVQPLWHPNCGSTAITSIAAKGCLFPGQSKVGNYFIQPGTGGGPNCFNPGPHQWVALACCSPKGYELLAPINLAELSWMLGGGSVYSSFQGTKSLVTKENWRQLAKNIILTDLLNFSQPGSQLEFQSLVKSAVSILEVAAPALGGLGFSAIDWKSTL